jgi:hypothetical protein
VLYRVLERCTGNGAPVHVIDTGGSKEHRAGDPDEHLPLQPPGRRQRSKSLLCCTGGKQHKRSNGHRNHLTDRVDTVRIQKVIDPVDVDELLA